VKTLERLKTFRSTLGCVLTYTTPSPR